MEREIVKNDFEPKYSEIVSLIEAQIDDTKKIFDIQKKIKDANKPIAIQRNMPEISGGLRWCNELSDRIKKPIEIFHRLIDHPILKSEQMIRVNKKYNELFKMLNEFSVSIYNDWCLHVGKLSSNNLEKNLIYRNPISKSINTNFDLQVIFQTEELSSIFGLNI